MKNKKFPQKYLSLPKYNPMGMNISSISLHRRKTSGLIYTLYSDEFNLIEINFSRTQENLANRLLLTRFTLLDRREGNQKELILLKDTLTQLGIDTVCENSFKYTNKLMRHLYTLGWPIGNSLYKPRKIRKELFLCG